MPFFKYLKCLIILTKIAALGPFVEAFIGSHCNTFIGTPKTLTTATNDNRRDVVITPLQTTKSNTYSSDLDTAYEWLAADRVTDDPENHVAIKWLNIYDTTNIAIDDDHNDIVKMPLYPLGAVHVPYSNENHTIINIEPRNVKMAMDLVNDKWGDGRLFCATLRARDTNRIASVGTVMQLIDTDDRSIIGARTMSGIVLPNLNRVVANCKAVGMVDIISIEKHEYADGDYLIANVKVHSLPNDSTNTIEGENEKLGTIAKQVIESYQKVRSIYINSASLASNELPKFARNAVQTLPTYNYDNVHNEMEFFQLIETWQMLCNTIRQSKRTNLQSIINELSVTVAMQAKGPLQLPVKRKSLPKEVQLQLEIMEQTASEEFMELGMDPILDFQELISMKDHSEKVTKLAFMIEREKLRLEAKESLIRAFLDEALLGEELVTPSNHTIFD